MKKNKNILLSLHFYRYYRNRHLRSLIVILLHWLVLIKSSQQNSDLFMRILFRLLPDVIIITKLPNFHTAAARLCDFGKPISRLTE